MNSSGREVGSSPWSATSGTRQPVAAMTAAGDGAYYAQDVPPASAAQWANLASDGLLEPFLVPVGDPDQDDRLKASPSRGSR